MAFDFSTLVTDRTADDVRRFFYLRDKGFENMTAEEQEEWMSFSLKGAYNTTDLMRVSQALDHLYVRLNAAGYITPSTEFTMKLNWTVARVPTTEDLSYYLRAVKIVREALAQLETTPPAPEDTGALNHIEANNIELILIDVENLINNMLAARHYCGDVFAGEI